MMLLKSYKNCEPTCMTNTQGKSKPNFSIKNAQYDEQNFTPIDLYGVRWHANDHSGISIFETKMCVYITYAETSVMFLKETAILLKKA